MDIDKIKAALADRILTVVSERTGVNYNTVLGIKTGRVANPHQKTLKALADYLFPVTTE